ncbi:hypothetical protein Phum_PHUM226840 [Pediculus humanus corporis]|uniref:Uncharacterized protein n=1 Tax=Pediculus humanus subsp. corporis TaxID=121224 RepID=E0VIF0_PEDHC|nr:uncharacterized protein Phum_PHUM226840 [Pediculus humanus corporis]EEB13156.1 hypothetical protein Phum_PHUM226840 [Pediculus humanus corporis]
MGILHIILWVSFSTIECLSLNSQGSQERKELITQRGFYSGLGFSYVLIRNMPFGEPLAILAGLAFLAYMIQAFHILYTNNGLLNNVLPAKNN